MQMSITFNKPRIKALVKEYITKMGFEILKIEDNDPNKPDLSIKVNDLNNILKINASKTVLELDEQEITTAIQEYLIKNSYTVLSTNIDTECKGYGMSEEYVFTSITVLVEIND